MTDQPPPADPPPAATPPPTPPARRAPPPTPASSPSSYPINLGFERDLAVQNWRPLVNWLLAIPHIIVLYGLLIAQAVLWFLSFFTVLFTKKNPFLGVPVDGAAVPVAGVLVRVLAAERVPAFRLHVDGARRRHRPGLGRRRGPRRDEPLARPREVAARDPAHHRARVPLHRGVVRAPDHLLRGAVHRKMARRHARLHRRRDALAHTR